MAPINKNRHSHYEVAHRYVPSLVARHSGTGTAEGSSLYATISYKYYNILNIVILLKKLFNMFILCILNQRLMVIDTYLLTYKISNLSKA